jgi:hypothetical protein
MIIWGIILSATYFEIFLFGQLELTDCYEGQDCPVYC